MIGTILLILLTLAVTAVYPIWTYNKHWGRGPAIGVWVLITVVTTLRVHSRFTLQLVASSMAHGLPGEFHDLDQHGFPRIDQLVQRDS